MLERMFSVQRQIQKEEGFNKAYWGTISLSIVHTVLQHGTSSIEDETAAMSTTKTVEVPLGTYAGIREVGLSGIAGRTKDALKKDDVSRLTLLC